MKLLEPLDFLHDLLIQRDARENHLTNKKSEEPRRKSGR